MYTHLLRLTGFLALLCVSCGGETPPDESPLGECPPNSQNQQTFGASILYTTCTGCHSQALEGEAREGAPVGKDYDTPELVRPQAEEILEWVLSGTMPPPDGLNELQMEYVRIYLACGAP
jgi:hypothetical protein